MPQELGESSARTTERQSRMKIAYVASRYPSVSHTFIMREIRALRGQGMDVRTYTIRRPAPGELLTDLDRQESCATYPILPAGPVRLLKAHVTAALAHPRRYCGTLWRAIRTRPPGIRAGLWRLFYFVEAGILAGELRREGIGHVHAHFANVAASVAMLASQMNGCRWSLTLHGPTDFEDPTLLCLTEQIHDAGLVVCISDFGRSQAMLHSDPEHWEKIHKVHCAIDTERFVPPAEPRTSKSGHLRLLNVGRMAPAKGHTILLHAVERVIARGIAVTCTLIGDGPDRARLQRLAAELGIAEHVVFAGAIGQEEIHAYYHQADIFVLSSFAEGLPVVLMEAMATGLPVIATHIMGIPELVEDEVNGLLVPASRVEPLADAIAGLARDPEKRRSLGEKGREKVQQEFESEHSAKQLVELFARACSVPLASVGQASHEPAVAVDAGA